MTAALEGVKIADFSWVGAGPRSTKDLADYGATVVKIESRKRLDLGRMSPPFKDGRRDPDGSAFFALSNTSKLGVTIDLGQPEGVAVAKRLIAWADVVVENFGKGFMERIGLSFAELQAIKPDIIQVSVSVAGRTGPVSGLRGYGNSAAALSGLAALSGWPDRAPHMPPFAYGDVVAPMFATMATLAALEHRRQAGRGQHIDISQMEPLIHVLGDVIAEAQAAGPAFERTGNRDADMAPHGIFPSRGLDQWIALAARDDADWEVLADELGLTDDPRFATLRARKANEDALDALVGAWTIGQDKHVLADRLAAAGLPAEAVQDGRDVYTDPELLAAGHFVRIDHAVLGACDMPGPPMHFSDSTVRVGPPPLLGEHNQQVLVGLLGMSEAEVKALAAKGVLA
jgi:benzylsuccinate CoA-transferase BbsF subunit